MQGLLAIYCNICTHRVQTTSPDHLNFWIHHSSSHGNWFIVSHIYSVVYGKFLFGTVCYVSMPNSLALALSLPYQQRQATDGFYVQ